jgi:MFS family permease
VLESLALMKFRSFAVLVLVAGMIGVVLAFYFACENPFLESVGVPAKQAGAYMTIGQIAEAVVMVLVPFTVARLGVKKTMLLGGGMWALRFALSMIGQPTWLMVVSIALHGFCFGFFFVVAQMYVDRAASGDIKASAQNLLIFIIYGLGSIAGSVLSGYLRDIFKTETGDDWTKIWAGPLVLTLLAMALFAIFFKEEELRKPVTASSAELVA